MNIRFGFGVIGGHRGVNERVVQSVSLNVDVCVVIIGVIMNLGLIGLMVRF